MTKPRADSWYATLSEEQLWQLYSVAKRCQWFETVAHAQKEFGLEAKVSRSAYYRWLDWMRGEESERRLAQARIAALEAGELAKTVGLKDETAIAAYKSLAAEFALKSDAKTANRFMQMAMALRDRQLRSREVDLKDAAQTTKDEQLKLAREKFEAAEKRLNAVKDAVKTAKANGGGLSEEALAKIEQAVGML
jgi:hypothetical protein